MYQTTLLSSLSQTACPVKVTDNPSLPLFPGHAVPFCFALCSLIYQYVPSLHMLVRLACIIDLESRDCRELTDAMWYAPQLSSSCPRRVHQPGNWLWQCAMEASLHSFQSLRGLGEARALPALLVPAVSQPEYRQPSGYPGRASRLVCLFLPLD